MNISDLASNFLNGRRTMSGWQSQHRRHTSKLASGVKCESQFAKISLQVVDAGFCGIIFVAPLIFGGRHDLGRLVFAVFTVVVALAWCCHQVALGGGKTTRTIAHGVIAVAILLVVLQLVPFPERFLELMSSRTGTLLPLHASEPENGSFFNAWQTLSLTPQLTRVALAMLVAYGLLFSIAVERFRVLDDIERLMNWIALAAIGMGIFALLQYFSSNGLFFWFYDLPGKYTDDYPKGSFANRNHFSHFLILGIGPLIAWIVRLHHYKIGCARDTLACNDVQRNHLKSISIAKSSMGLLACLIIVMSAVLLSLSRGGAIAMAVALTITLLLLYRAGLIAFRTIYAGCGVVIVMIGILSIYGYDRVENRLNDLTAGSLEKVDNQGGRRKIWAANIAAIHSGGLFGSGAGSHRQIYPVYLEHPYPKTFTHAECGYLQIITENGFLGGCILLIALSFTGYYCFRFITGKFSPRIVLCTSAVTASLAASVLHSLIDFVWYIPACMSLALLQLACALNLYRLSLSSGRQQQYFVSLVRSRWIEMGLAVLLVGTWMTSVLLGPAIASIPADRYLRASLADRKNLQHQINTQADQQVETGSSPVHLEWMMSNLNDILRWHPYSSWAHHKLATRYLQLFESAQDISGNFMTTSMVRDAAIASEFESPKNLHQWLIRAFGGNANNLYKAIFHARRAIALNPLHGESYLLMAQLCFLEGRNLQDVDTYLSQSLRVRPQDVDVLFEVGKHQLLIGQVDQAIEYWRNAFRSRGSHQMQMMQYMTGQISASDFIGFFQPDWFSLAVLWKRYCNLGNSEDLKVLANYGAKIAQADCLNSSIAEQTHIWLTLSSMQSHMDDLEGALSSLHQAYKIAPNNYRVRRSLGHALIRDCQYRQAESHFRWCLARQPNNKGIQRALIQAVQGRTARNLHSDSSQHLIK
jgi:tetratricopeptide (TPR) repeat protein/O-antigen ligase